MPIPDSSTSEASIVPAKENKFAVVVGVNNSSVSPYLPPLKHAENDAYEMFQTLRQPACRFTFPSPVLLGDKAETRDVRRAVVKLAQRKADLDFLLFYFIGHAQPMKTKGGRDDIYFVTYDFHEDEVKEDPTSHLSMRWLREILYQPNGPGSVLVVLDCCYAGNIIDAEPDPFHIDLNLRRLVEECFDGSSIMRQNNRLRVMLTATGYNTPAQEKENHTLMTGLLLPALQGKIFEALDYKGDVNIHTLHMYLQTQMPQEHFPNLSGEVTRICTLASYPELSEDLRKKAQQIEENELKDEVVKLRHELKIITSPDFFEKRATPQFIYPFDHSVCKDASIADLDLEKIIEFLKKDRVHQQEDFRLEVSNEDQLRQFGFVQHFHPTYGALLCFGRNPSQWIPGAFTRCTRWRGKDRREGWVDDQSYRGNLLRQFELSRDFLQKSLRLGRVIDGEGRAEQWEMPFVALEEALANALVHREYANQKEFMHQTRFVHIEVFDDRVEISSPGNLPPPMKIELLGVENKCHPRNPQIARIFYLSGFVEEVGSGIPRMQYATESMKLPSPKFELSPAETFKVILYRRPVNPFIVGSPITGSEMFFGREDVFQFIRQALIGQHRDNVIILYGPHRRIGKSSILCQMRFRLDTRYLCILTDMYSFAFEGLGGFLWELANHILRALHRDYQIQLSLPNRAEFMDDPRSCFENKVLSQIRPSIGDRHILLMLDEVYYLQEQVQVGKLEHNIFEYMRYLMQHYEWLNFLFSLGSGREEMEKEYAFLFNVGLYKKISFLDHNATRDLITEPVKGYCHIDPAAIDRIYQVTSGHPYYTQLVCHGLFNRWQRLRIAHIEVRDVDDTLDEVIEYGAMMLRFSWEELTRNEKVTLASMAATMGKNNDAIDVRNINRIWKDLIPEDEGREAIKGLIARDIVAGEDKYVFTVDLQRLWIQKYRFLEQVIAEIPTLPISKPSPQVSRYVQSLLNTGKYVSRRTLVLSLAGTAIVSSGLTWFATKTAVPEINVETAPHRITVTVDSNGLLSNSLSAVNAVKEQIRTQSFLKGRQAAFVIVYGGASNDSQIPTAQEVAQKIYDVLHKLGQEGFVFQRASYYQPLYNLGSSSTLVSIDIYLFVQ